MRGDEANWAAALRQASVLEWRELVDSSQKKRQPSNSLTDENQRWRQQGEFHKLDLQRRSRYSEATPDQQITGNKSAGHAYWLLALLPLHRCEKQNHWHCAG